MTFKVVGNWTVASIPQKQPELFPDAALNNKFHWLNKHAKLSYYTIDQLFYRDADMPANIANSRRRESYRTRICAKLTSGRYSQKETSRKELLLFCPHSIWHSIHVRTGTVYNYNANDNEIDSDGGLLNPRKSWAGIMRRVDQNDFEAANIDYVEIWLMDPLMDNPNLTRRAACCILGNVSEDILPRSAENRSKTDCPPHAWQSSGNRYESIWICCHQSTNQLCI